jgi:FkbM family methyltransferase
MNNYKLQRLGALKNYIKYSLLAPRHASPDIPNEFTYAACRSSAIPFPDIPVKAVEHYGQCGEDIIVRALLRAMAMRKNVDLREKLYLEIGGNHPFATSSTYLLSRSFGMKGVVVEANARLLDNLKKGRPDDVVIHGAVQDQDVEYVMFSISNLSEISSIDSSFVTNWGEGRSREVLRIKVPALRIKDLFKKHTNGKEVVYLSIDVEGMDLSLLKDMDFRDYRPWIVQAEPSDNHIPGNSAAISDHMRTVGYKLVALTGVNLIFAEETI